MRFRFLQSSHKWLYLRLAIRFRTSPDHVYKLAHGWDEVNTHKDHMIVHYFRKHDCFKDVRKKKSKESPHKP